MAKNEVEQQEKLLFVEMVLKIIDGTFEDTIKSSSQEVKEELAYIWDKYSDTPIGDIILKPSFK